MTKITEAQAEEYLTDLEAIQATFKPRVFKRHVPKSEYPEIVITVPDHFDTIELAPLYDVHIGSKEHDEALLERHLRWIAETPNVFTWNGGDAFENKTPKQADMGYDAINPEEQLLEVTRKFAVVQHKMLFSIPGNHEDRTFKQSGMSASKRLAENLKVPYFNDYAILTIKWRGNSFRGLCHHGAGGAQTAGAQRNSARKELVWMRGMDFLWTGHLHQPMTDNVRVVDVDQKTGRTFEKDVLVIISPSYLKYFGGYAAKSRMAPGSRGLTVVVLNPDGRMDASIHANGKRL
jgi:calcineurin-like phosphoesterase family protein